MLLDSSSSYWLASPSPVMKSCSGFFTDFYKLYFRRPRISGIRGWFRVSLRGHMWQVIRWSEISQWQTAYWIQVRNCLSEGGMGSWKTRRNSVFDPFWSPSCTYLIKFVESYNTVPILQFEAFHHFNPPLFDNICFNAFVDVAFAVLFLFLFFILRKTSSSRCKNIWLQPKRGQHTTSPITLED